MYVAAGGEGGGGGHGDGQWEQIRFTCLFSSWLRSGNY